MIEATIKQIRKDFSDMWVFLFCHSATCSGQKITKAKYNIEKKIMTFSAKLPGKVRMIDVNLIFPKDEAPSYHLSHDVELEKKKPEVKFYD